MPSYYDKLLCPVCKKIPEFSHDQSGGPITKCSTTTCEGAKRWLSYDEWEEFQQSLEVILNV